MPVKHQKEKFQEAFSYQDANEEDARLWFHL
jgi:hypothetical protein